MKQSDSVVVSFATVLRAVWMTPLEAAVEFPNDIQEIAQVAEDLGFWQWAAIVYALPAILPRLIYDRGRLRGFMPLENLPPRELVYVTQPDHPLILAAERRMKRKRRDKAAHMARQARRRPSVEPEPPPSWTPEYAVFRSGR